MNKSEHLAEAYLRERGTNLRRARGAGWLVATDSEARHLGSPYSAAAFVIPYPHPVERELVPELWRFRYLTEPLPVDRDGKAVRYAQPTGSSVEAYFDPHVDWLEVFGDPSIDIAITEGEVKALYMNQNRRELGGIVTIALGGVWNFRDKETGDLTPWLRMVRAASSGRGRNFLIAFDSDIAENPGIQAAAAKLSELLNIEVRGVTV